MSNGGAEHKITGCPGCDAEEHQTAVREREKQQSQERAMSASLVLAMAVVGLVLIGLWAGVMALLSRAFS
ncbi:hypothetical protein ACFY12_03900 [Streptomyces sp. NPDC001339]|uniref:hypothetical protein n=1 Tax=Streptomyces sp. NPDC001339 TaxID=3364563 RepID=UPI0036B17CB5